MSKYDFCIVFRKKLRKLIQATTNNPFEEVRKENENQMLPSIASEGQLRASHKGNIDFFYFYDCCN